MRRPLVVAMLIALCAGSPAIAQTITLTGFDGHVQVVTADRLAALPTRRMWINTQGGEKTEFEGVSLADVLRLAGAPFGQALRGTEMADVVLVTARDGYAVALSLAEADPSIRPGAILMADMMNGRPLPPNDAPIRLVVDGDSRLARSARMVTAITLLRLTSPGVGR